VHLALKGIVQICEFPVVPLVQKSIIMLAQKCCRFDWWISVFWGGKKEKSRWEGKKYFSC